MRRKHRRASWLAACLFWLFSSSVWAQDVTPFNTFNQSPIIQVHGLPYIDRGTVLPPGENRFRLISDTANHFTRQSSGGEYVLFDGEIERTTFSYTRGYGEDIEWGFRIPYISHSGGTLDHLIENWHDLLGIPQKGRESWPRNRLTYLYTRDGITTLNLTDSSSGMGDVQLHGAWQWQKAKTKSEANLSMRVQASLPTGDSDRLLGSGGIDLAVWMSGDRIESWFDYPGNLWGGTGVLLLGDGDVLEEQQRRFALFGSIGSGAKISDRLTLKLQLDFHTPLYKHSSLVQISGHAVQFSMGGDIRLSRNTRLDLAVKEDPTVNASPDVVFHIGLTIDEYP